MIRRLLLCVALVALAVPLCGGDCTNGGHFQFKVLGPEAHDNLWQFAAVRGWKATSSGTTYSGGHNNARMVYQFGYYYVDDNACAFGLSTANGSTLVVVGEYTSGANTTGQKAFYAAASFSATVADPTIADATMHEVPQVSAVNASGTVTVSWTEPPAQTEVVGYRIIRSSDGIAGWSTVADVLTGVTSQGDTPGAGTWYYALQIIYLNDGTNKVVSPHGLAASVVVP